MDTTQSATTPRPNVLTSALRHARIAAAVAQEYGNGHPLHAHFRREEERAHALVLAALIAYEATL